MCRWVQVSFQQVPPLQYPIVLEFYACLQAPRGKVQNDCEPGRGAPPPLEVLYMPTDTLYQCAKFKMPAKMRPLLDIFYTKR